MPALFKLLAAAAPAAESDADLLARFVATRDDAAFAELVRRHGPTVYGTCRRLVGPSAADDAFQATFLVLAARAASVRKAASVGSWLIGVAGRVGRRMLRREDRRQRTEDRWKRTAPALASSTDLRLLSSDLCEALADELTRLPDRLRAAAVACLVDGRTQDQAAAALGWSSRTVRRRLDEAKGLLRARLERRGVTPAVAAAAVTTAGEAAAVPAGLGRRTTEAATLFLAGGGAPVPASVIAHGVIGAMTTVRSMTAAAACVAVLVGLGVGWAHDSTPPLADAPVDKAAPERIPAPVAPKATPPAAHTHRTANFVVEAPTAAVARAIGEEYERQRAAAARAWLGKDLPAWKEPAMLRLKAGATSGWYDGTIDFRAAPGAELGAAVSGSLDVLLDREAPYYGACLVLTTHLGRPLPLWVAMGLGDLTATDADRTRDTATAQRQLAAGEAYRLQALFRVTTRNDSVTILSQSLALVRFLLSREPDRRHSIVEGGSHALIDPPPPLAPGQAATKRGLLTFVESGGRLTEVYGFASLADMERAWVEWLRAQPGAAPVTPAVAPDRIPPPGTADTPAAVGATWRTTNFAVTAPNAKVALAVAEAAEKHRKGLATRWLGKELPAEKQPIPVTVIVTMNASGGSTTFTFGAADGKRPPGVATAAMELRGPLDAVMASVLPHEVMHVVLATHFGRPIPRWADEGIAVLAESEAEQRTHEVRARELLNAGRAIRLATLFRMTEYPRDTIVTFAQGYSVCRFLLDRGAADPRPGGPPGERGHKTVQYPGGPIGTQEIRFARGDREPALLGMALPHHPRYATEAG